MIRIRTQGAAVGRALGFLVVTLVGAVLLMTSEPADAAFPGTNGKIAFASNRDRDFEIFTMNADDSDQIKLTNNGVFDVEPAWSPHARRIALTRLGSTLPSNYEILTIRAAGGDVTNLTNSPAFDAEPDWQPQ